MLSTTLVAFACSNKVSARTSATKSNIADAAAMHGPPPAPVASSRNNNCGEIEEHVGSLGVTLVEDIGPKSLKLKSKSLCVEERVEIAENERCLVRSFLALGGVGGAERVVLCCLVWEKSSWRGSLSHEATGEPRGGGFGVSSAMLDISEGVGEVGISTVRAAMPVTYFINEKTY